MKLSSSIPNLKAEAKRQAKEMGISLTQAQNQIAEREGFANWSLLAKKVAEHHEVRRQSLPKVIDVLPLTGSLRSEAVSVAEAAFARALGRMEARNPRKARTSWNAEFYVDRILTPDKAPIDTDEALSLLEAFVVMDAVEAAVDADGPD